MSRKTRKLIWSAPLVAVLAVAGALAMFAAQGTGSVFANPLPDAPMNLEVEAASGDAGRTTLVLNWDAAANAAGYRIDISDQGAVWETMMMDTGSTATSYTDDTLTADDTRWYRVFALNRHGIGPVSNPDSGTTDDKVSPGSVMNLTVSPNPDKPYHELDLSWEAPTMNGGEKIVGYEIQIHTGGQWEALEGTAGDGNVTATTDTEYTYAPTETVGGNTVPALDPGDSRRFRVRAVNGPGALTTGADVDINDDEDSVSEDWVQKTGTTKAASAPGQVTGLTAVNASATTINLYWYDPEDTGGFDIAGYLIQAHRQGKKFKPVPKDDDLEIAADVTTTALGTGDTLNNHNQFIAANDATTAHQVVFTSTPLDHDGDGGDGTNGTTADRHVKWYFSVYALTFDNGTNEATDTEGEADDVIRRSSKGSSKASATAAARTTFDHDDDTGTTGLDKLAAPGISATPTTGADAVAAQKQKIILSLTLDGTLVDTATDPDTIHVQQIAYRIDYSDDEAKSWKLLERDTRFTGFSEDRDYTDDDGLGFDEDRRYRVFAIGDHAFNDVGLSSAMATGMTAASTAPKAPTGAMAMSPSLRSIHASWTAPKDNGGQPVVKYILQWVPDDGDDVAETADFNTGTNPEAETADRQHTVTKDAMAMVEFDFPTTPTRMPALKDDTVYVFRVAAVNKTAADPPVDRPATDPIVEDGTAGAPNWSKPVLFDTTEAAKPNAVEGLTSEAATDASGNITGVNLLWNKPSDKIMISNYDIEFLDEDGDWVNPTGDAENATPNRTSYTDPDDYTAEDIAAGVVRKYRVRATNMAGEGPWTMVYYPRDPDTHTHVAPSGTIPAQSVTVGETETVNAAGYFSDNTGATYEAESDDTDVATVMVDGSTVTITGVSVGTANITVTATSGAVEAEQMFMVTVTPAALGPPMNVMAMVDTQDPARPNVTVTWTDGENSDAHWVGLYDAVNNRTYGSQRVAGDPSAMTHTFVDVAPGTYLPAVISTLEGFTPLVDYARLDDGRPRLTVVAGQ